MRLKAIDYMEAFASGMKNPSSFKYLDLTFVTGTKTYPRIGEKPCMAIWRGRQSKPYSRYHYKSEETLMKEAMNQMSRADERKAYKDARREEKKNFVPDVKVGDVFVASWGYDQTCVDAYEVVEKVSKHFVKVKELCWETVEGSEGFMSDKRIPIKGKYRDNQYGVDERKFKVGMHGIKISSCQFAMKWDEEKRESFYCSWYG